MTNATKILATADEILAAWPVMSQLRPHIAESEFVKIVAAQQGEGYLLAAHFEGDEIACVAGFRITHSLASGRHLYVDDLVTDERRRSNGAGKAMFDWLVEYARKNNCRALHLDSGVQRHGAHRFYLRERMDIVFYHFRLDL